MATSISSLYGPARAILGDHGATQYTDAALLAVVQMVVLTGQLEGYALSGDQASITPSLASPRDYGVVLYKTAVAFVAPQSQSYGFRTRALSERFGEQRVFVAELQRVLYRMENPDMLGSWGDFATWLTGVTGLNIFENLTQMQVSAPVATARLSVAGLTVSGGTQA